MRKIFIEIDTDKNGYIDFEEFKNYFRENESCEEIEDIREVFDAIDLNSNDRIEYREFIASNMRRNIKEQMIAQSKSM